MSRLCNNCSSKMVDNCDVHEYMGCNIVVSKKGEGFFNKASDSVKASVCTNCGNVYFYIDNFKEFEGYSDY